MSANLSYDSETANRHAAKIMQEANALAGKISGTASGDISNAFGLMCQFLAGDFMAMAASAEESLTSARQNITDTCTKLTDSSRIFTEVEVESAGQVRNVDGVMAEVSTDAFRIVSRMA